MLKLSHCLTQIPATNYFKCDSIRPAPQLAMEGLRGYGVINWDFTLARPSCSNCFNFSPTGQCVKEDPEGRVLIMRKRRYPLTAARRNPRMRIYGALICLSARAHPGTLSRCRSSEQHPGPTPRGRSRPLDFITTPTPFRESAQSCDGNPNSDNKAMIDCEHNLATSIPASE